jgi:hypothetical protein
VDIQLPKLPKLEEELGVYVGGVLEMKYGVGLLSDIEITSSETGSEVDSASHRIVSRIGKEIDGKERVCISLFPGLIRKGCGGVLTKELVITMLY